MRNFHSRPSNAKVVIYAVLLALVCSMVTIVVQDIKAPTEHVSHQVKINLE